VTHVWLVTGGADRLVRIIDAETGRCFRILEGHHCEISCVVITDDGKKIVSSSKNEIKIWDTQMGTCVRHIEGCAKWVHHMCIHERQLVTCAGELEDLAGELKMWDIDTGEMEMEFEGHNARVSCCAFTKDGEKILAAQDKSWQGQNLMKLWEAHTGRCLVTFCGVRSHKNQITCCDISRDALYVVSGDIEAVIKLWDALSGDCLQTYTGHLDQISSAIFLYDPFDETLDAPTAFITGSRDTTIRSWKMDRHYPRKPEPPFSNLFGHTNLVKWLCLSKSNTWMVSSSYDNTLRLWNICTGVTTRTLQGHHRDWGTPIVVCGGAVHPQEQVRRAEEKGIQRSISHSKEAMISAQFDKQQKVKVRTPPRDACCSLAPDFRFRRLFFTGPRCGGNRSAQARADLGAQEEHAHSSG
jgi:WD40 repeat protein